MKVLFDNGVPDRLSRSLKHHSVTFARTLGWDQLSNGKLLQAAEAQQFEVMVTTDKNIKNQQNLTKRRIALVVLSNQQWPLVKLKQAEITRAVDMALPNSYAEVFVPFLQSIKPPS